jgi:ABC-type nitrate/sulfonate/bicarbonate transport system permease component
MASWPFAIRGVVPRPAAVALGVVPVVALIVVWWAITRGEVESRLISPTILPSPAEVLHQAGDLFTRRDPETHGNALWHHLRASVRRVSFGFAIAAAVCLPIGVLMGAFGSIRATLTPIVTASGYIPIATLVPLTMSWFGTGEEQKVIFLALAFGAYLLPLTVQAVDAVPDVYLRTASTLGATRAQIVLRVLVPVAAPGIWQALRLAFGVGWTYLVLTEALVLTDGLGFLVEFGRRRGPREQIYLVIMIITVVAWLADLAWDRLGRLLFPYRTRR